MSYRVAFLSTVLIATAHLANAQTNLLQNPAADQQSQSWRAYQQATIEPCEPNNPCFVLRNGGYFLQDISVPEAAVGQFAVLIGRASAERVKPDGSITGLPYLYGYMMDGDDPRSGKIIEYLQGQGMSARNASENEWRTLSGIFKVPDGTKRIRLFLKQALAKDSPHDGSATRFDDVGVYLFKTKQEAQSFLDSRH